MTKQSAGLLVFRRNGPRCAQGPCAVLGLEIFLVHPGGPYFKRKDEGVWSIPKGLIDPDETPLRTALREFEEETSMAPPPPSFQNVPGGYLPLEPVRQKSGKRVRAWAVEDAAGAVDAAQVVSNTFELEWPPGSGRITVVPEVDRGAWFTAEAARPRIIEAQWGLVEQLERALRDGAR